MTFREDLFLYNCLQFVAYVKSVLGKAAKEQLQKESGGSSRRTSVVGNDDDSSNNKAGKARKVRSESSKLSMKMTFKTSKVAADTNILDL